VSVRQERSAFTTARPDSGYARYEHSGRPTKTVDPAVASQELPGVPLPVCAYVATHERKHKTWNRPIVRRRDRLDDIN